MMVIIMKHNTIFTMVPNVYQFEYTLPTIPIMLTHIYFRIIYIRQVIYPNIKTYTHSKEFCNSLSYTYIHIYNMSVYPFLYIDLCVYKDLQHQNLTNRHSGGYYIALSIILCTYIPTYRNIQKKGIGYRLIPKYICVTKKKNNQQPFHFIFHLTN